MNSAVRTRVPKVLILCKKTGHTVSSWQSFHLDTTSKTKATMGGDQESYVFIRDPEYAWIPAIKTGDDGKKAQVKVPKYRDEQSILCDGGAGAKEWEEDDVPLKDYNKGVLPLQNVDGAGHLKPFPDMCQLTFLHEVCVKIF
jgi:hypothetical protein